MRRVDSSLAHERSDTGTRQRYSDRG
jgi:hypothetical protein